MIEPNMLIQFLLSSMVLTISPGPDIIYVITQSISNGKKYGIYTSAGLVCGILIHTTLVYLGVSLLIRENPILFTGLKYLGAIYLLYLAYQVYRSDSNQQIDFDQKVTKKSPSSLFVQGFVMNVLNPKVTLFFLAYFPGFIEPNKGQVALQTYELGLVFMIQAFLIFSILAVLADRFTAYIRKNRNFQPIIKWAQLLVFIGLAIFLVL